MNNYDNPPTTETTTDRLVRIMDEERSLHIAADKDVALLPH